MRIREKLAALGAVGMLSVTLVAAPAAASDAGAGPTPIAPTIEPGTPLSELETDGWFQFEAPAAHSEGANSDAFSVAAFERWFSGEFKASLSGAKWYHSGGNIHATIAVSNCTPGYGSIEVSLVRSVGGVITNTWPVEWGCGGNLYYNWGHHLNGTYNLYFSRGGPTGHDENTKRVEGSVTYNP